MTYEKNITFLSNGYFNLTIISNTSRDMKSHAYYSSNDSELWNWSFEDLAENDIPALLEHVFNITGEKISFIGHSLGAATGLMALQDAENEKMVKNYIGLGKVSKILELFYSRREILNERMTTMNRLIFLNFKLFRTKLNLIETF